MRLQLHLPEQRLPVPPQCHQLRVLLRELRRALPTLAGRLLEPQEKSMICPAADAQTRLALCAALLLLDLDA